jgi:hypothetical protein
MHVVNWLDLHNGLVQAVSTSLLVLLTAAYVIWTAKISSAQRQATDLARDALADALREHLDSQTPNVVMQVTSTDFSMFSDVNSPEYRMILYIQILNYGPTPAVIVMHDPPTGIYDLEHARPIAADYPVRAGLGWEDIKAVIKDPLIGNQAQMFYGHEAILGPGIGLTVMWSHRISEDEYNSWCNMSSRLTLSCVSRPLSGSVYDRHEWTAEFAKDAPPRFRLVAQQTRNYPSSK